MAAGKKGHSPERLRLHTSHPHISLTLQLNASVSDLFSASYEHLGFWALMVSAMFNK